MPHPYISLRWLFLAHLLLSGNVSGKIEKLKSCGKKALCHGKNPKLHESQFNPKLGNISLCNCDENCAEYGDCCLDIISHQKRKSRENSWMCIPININESVYAVSNCDFNNEHWKDRCEKNIAFDKYHYMLDVPVYSHQTRLLYANIYCAFCHHQLSYVVQPRLSVKCSENITIEMLLKNGVYQKGKLFWKVRNGLCSIFLNEEVKYGRPCLQSISKCPSHSHKELSTKCNIYSMMIIESDKIYRNPHCALCNGINLNKTRCWNLHQYKTLPSLSMILNFDWNFDSCEVPESVWDGLQQRCISISCQNGRSCEISTWNNSNQYNETCQKVQEQLTLKIDGYVTLICLSTSVFCLLLHMLMSICLPHPKTVPNKILDSLAFSLMIAQLLFLCGIYPLFSVPNHICHAIAILIQFFFLASFFWMNAMSIDIFSTFSNSSLKKYSRKSHSKYAFYAWGGAIFVTALSVTAELTNFLPEYYRPLYAARQNLCWFGNHIGLAIFFYFPIFFILLSNAVLFTITVYWFQKQQSSSETLKSYGRKDYNRLWLYIKLSTIMGTAWAFGLVTSITNMPNYRYLFTVLNGLQGAFIFFMFDLKSEVLFTFLKQIGFKGFWKNSKTKGRSEGTQSSQTSTLSTENGKT